MMLRRYALLIMLLLAAGGPAFAIAVDADSLPDAGQETRARGIMSGLRCLVCQNQSIESSNATLAVDLRQIVRQRVVAGDSDDQVRGFIVARYGDWVLMRPPFRAATLLLWLGPPGLLFIGAALVWSGLRRHRQAVEPAALSDSELAQLEKMLGPE